jgi:hypothetical protein
MPGHLGVMASGGRQYPPDPPGRRHCGCHVISEQDALAGTERDLLDHARKPHLLRRLPHRLVRGRGGRNPERGLGHARACPPLPLPGLVAGVPHGSDGIVWQPQSRGHSRRYREHRGIRGNHCGDRPAARQERLALPSGSPGLTGTTGRPPSGRAVAADDQIKVHPGGCQKEVGGAVGAGGH